MIEKSRVDEKIPVTSICWYFSSQDLVLLGASFAADNGHGEPESRADLGLVGVIPELPSSLGSNISLTF